MAPLLGVKFFSLALKTLSKPIASRIRRYVMNHPDWRCVRERNERFVCCNAEFMS